MSVVTLRRFFPGEKNLQILISGTLPFVKLFCALRAVKINISKFLFLLFHSPPTVGTKQKRRDDPTSSLLKNK